MPRALILGGTGLVGRAAALRLAAAGWQVDVVGRDPARMPPELVAAGGKFIAADRADERRMRAALGPGPICSSTVSVSPRPTRGRWWRWPRMPRPRW